MRAEDYGIAGKAVRILLKMSLAALFFVQYAALILQLINTGAIRQYHGIVTMLIYPAPMVFGLVLLQNLTLAKKDGSIRISHYYKSLDWSLLTLMACYGCIMRLPPIS